MLAHLAAFAALLPAATAPVTLAPAVPAPTGVTIAWASGDHKNFVATWHEDGPQADHITANRLDGAPVPGYQWDVAADQPDQLTFSNLPPDEDLRLTVTPVDASGQAVGEAGRSPAFDTDRQPAPRITESLPRADGTVLLTWTAPVYHDDTPNDPLDLPPVPIGFVPIASDPGINEWVNMVDHPITATSFVVPARPMPQWVGVETAPNEFGYNDATTALDRTVLKASVPPTAVTGRSMRVTGTAQAILRECDPGPCWETPNPELQSRVLRLQARTGAGASWQTVATTTSAAKTGKYSFRLTSPGTRDYRVVAEPVGWKPGIDGYSYAATGAVTTRSSDGGGVGLPITGAPAAWIAAAGALLAVLGAGLVLVGRRRKSTEV